jgi:uncharacterized ubiquitin-like protein YukD
MEVMIIYILLRSGERIQLTVEPELLIKELKGRIASFFSHELISQKLYYGGKLLSDDKTLSHYNIKHGNSLRMHAY